MLLSYAGVFIAVSPKLSDFRDLVTISSRVRVVRYWLQPETFRRMAFHDLHYPPAASRIRFAIVSGCDISETWLAFTSIVLAPMRLAMKRWRSGSMVRSSVDTAYQLGFDRHAACVVLPESNSLWNGHCTAYSAFAFVSGKSAAKSRRKASSLRRPSSPSKTMPADAGGVGKFLARAV